MKVTTLHRDHNGAPNQSFLIFDDRIGRGWIVPFYQYQRWDADAWPFVFRSLGGAFVVRWGAAYARAFDSTKEAVEFCRLNFFALQRGEHVGG